MLKWVARKRFNMIDGCAIALSVSYAWTWQALAILATGAAVSVVIETLAGEPA